MQIGVMGLRKMGFNLALNLTVHGHMVIGYDSQKLSGEFGFE